MTDNKPEQNHSRCITEYRDAHGYFWRYEDSGDEPPETLIVATRIAATVAEDEARKSGKSYVVASTAEPNAVHALAYDHPELSNFAMTIIYEFTPEGQIVHRQNTRQ